DALRRAFARTREGLLDEFDAQAVARREAGAIQFAFGVADQALRLGVRFGERAFVLAVHHDVDARGDLARVVLGARHLGLRRIQLGAHLLAERLSLGELGVLRLLVRANARGDPLPPDQHGADQEDDRAPDLRPHRQILEAHAAPPSARSSISPASASTMRGSSSRARSISRSTSSCALAAISPARACAATRIASLSRAVSTRAFAIAASASRRAAARRSSA